MSMYNKDATMELQKVDFDYRQNDSLIQQKVYDECATHELLKIVQYPKIASYQKVNTLIKKGANPNAVEEYAKDSKWNVLQKATVWGSANAVRALLDNGVNMDPVMYWQLVNKVQFQLKHVCCEDDRMAGEETLTVLQRHNRCLPLFCEMER